MDTPMTGKVQQLCLPIQARHQGRLVRTPTVLQLENTECGAASLSIVLQHYGKYVPLTQLRELCGVSRDGSDAASLVLAARSLGFNAKGFTKGLIALAKVKPPAILYWEFNHFLVFEGFFGDRLNPVDHPAETVLSSGAEVSVQAESAEDCLDVRVVNFLSGPA